VPVIPNVFLRRDRRIEWPIVSKAADKSRRVRMEIFPKSEACRNCLRCGLGWSQCCGWRDTQTGTGKEDYWKESGC